MLLSQCQAPLSMFWTMSVTPHIPSHMSQTPRIILTVPSLNSYIKPSDFPNLFQFFNYFSSYFLNIVLFLHFACCDLYSNKACLGSCLSYSHLTPFSIPWNHSPNTTRCFSVVKMWSLLLLLSQVTPPNSWYDQLPPPSSWYDQPPPPLGSCNTSNIYSLI